MKRAVVLFVVIVAAFFLNQNVLAQGFQPLGANPIFSEEIAAGNWTASLSGQGRNDLNQKLKLSEKMTVTFSNLKHFSGYYNTVQANVDVVLGKDRLGIGDLSFTINGNNIWVNLMVDPIPNDPLLLDEVDYDCDLIYYGDRLEGSCKVSGWLWDDGVKEWMQRTSLHCTIIMKKAP
ncbi:MAG: hypothetical protein V1845_00410 [bacterium]